MPNPSGYYGLAIPENLEKEISELPKKKLSSLVSSLAYYINEADDFEVGCTLSAVSVDFDCYASSLNEESLIQLLRWLCDRLSFLVSNPITPQSHAASAT